MNMLPRPSLRSLFVLGTVTLGALGLLAAPSIGRACFIHSPQPVQVWLDHVNVEITNNVAVKRYDCTFKNPNPQAVVGGTCYMELEPGAQIDDMSVWVDGKETKGEILDVAKAKEVFADIVKNGGSPALLEYFGNQLITTQIPRIAPNGTVKVELQYTMALKSRGGLVRMQMLNTNPKALVQPLKSAGVTVKIKSADPIKNLYSPTHEIKIEEDKDWDVVAKWEQEDYLPRHPFVLYYDTDPRDVGASLITHRELDEEGAFMLMLSPTVGSGKGQVPAGRVLPKDVVFCVDTSGSMLQGGKMEQARKALEYCVKQLRDGDRFNIVPFGTTVRSYHEDGLVEANDESRAKALRYVSELHARGGTAIKEALETSLKHLEGSDRLKMILFATDGLPTIGETDPQVILRSLTKQNTQDVRIFVFGEGYDVNTKLLDFLALNNRGEAEYILPEEDIAQKIGGFFDRVGSPLLTDVSVKIDGVEVKDVFPRQVKDMFRGEQVIVYGRYTGHGPKKTVTVTGRTGEGTQTFTYEFDFPEVSEDDKGSFVPRLWAGRKVDFLLGEIRKHEEAPQELVEEVTFLAKRYGIVTPYTSYLMTDDMIAQNGQRDEAAQLRERLKFAAPGLNGAPGADGAPATQPAAGPAGGLGGSDAKKLEVEAAKSASEARRALGRGGAGDFDAAADAALELGEESSATSPDAAGKPASLTVMRYIGTKTFYKSGESWFESDFQRDKHKVAKTIQVGSDEYVDLLLKHAGLAKFLALGDLVIQIDGTWYRFEEAKK
jgi:Ca-activated chloride channel family protein